MEILFTKTGGDDHILSCKRKDGSVTWKHVSAFFMLHDLCHFAVETILPLKNGFYGMVAAGTDINDFDLPKEQRGFQLKDEAIFAEHLVNLLAIEYTQGRMENFIEIFTSIYDGHVISNQALQINETKLDEIRIVYKELMEKWYSLPVNETMKLTFDE